MTHRSALRVAILATAVAISALPAVAEQGPGPGRGELLYTTHCIECHTVQIHWRETHKARDWASLVNWVTRWQATLSLDWSDSDIAAVARHLNEKIYGFAMPSVQARQ
jgi:cytochrome c5